MKKVLLLATVCVLCFGVVAADAAPKKLALSARISWIPGSDNSTSDRDFAVGPHFSMGDEILRYKLQEMGYFPILMPDYVVQFYLLDGEMPFPSGDDADYFPWVDDGVFNWYPTFLEDEGYALCWNTGTCWSSIGPPLKSVPVPVIQGEHANLGDRESKIGSTFIFSGSSSGDISGENAQSITLTEAGKVHELTAGLPDVFNIYGDGPDGPPEDLGRSWQGIFDMVDNAAPGAEVLAVWTSDPTKAAVAVIEAGASLSDGTPAPARRVLTFYGGGNERPVSDDAHPMVWIEPLDYLTPEGTSVIQRCVQWALGETVTPVAQWGDM